MTKLHRKELKHDEVRDRVADAVKSVKLHGREVVYMILIVAAVAGIALAWYFYERNQQENAQNLFGQAMEKFNAPVLEKADPNIPKPTYNFSSDTQKYTEAKKDFETVFSKYGNTPAADMARYMAGICSYYLKDSAKAEEYLKQSSKISDRNILYYQSRIALAELYSKTNRYDEAIKVLNEALNRPKPQAPLEYVMMQLGDVYEKAGKTKEARDLYQKVVNDYKDSAAGFQAQQKLNQVK
jgi:tetratricopeptide (TPR) repeat protein